MPNTMKLAIRLLVTTAAELENAAPRRRLLPKTKRNAAARRSAAVKNRLLVRRRLLHRVTKLSTKLHIPGGMQLFLFSPEYSLR